MSIFGPLGPSLAGYIRSSRTLTRWIKPVAVWYADLAGYRKMGLKYDDLLVEEKDSVQRALLRLTPREGYDRAFRIKTASQCSILHKDLPKDQWLPADQDIRYLKPHLDEVLKEDDERQDWDNMTIERRRH